LKEALDNKGVTNEIKSRLRAEVFSILEDNTFEKPRVSQENLLINELIREYMDFNHYKYSKSVFLKGIKVYPYFLRFEATKLNFMSCNF
jgi:lisH domain-containing protein FOPNL